MSEDPNNEEVEGPEVKEKKTKPMLWLRPVVGLFSIIVGVLYLIAALGGAVFRGIITKFLSSDETQRQETIDSIVTSGETPEQAAATVDKLIQESPALAAQFGSMYTLMIAATAAIALIIGFSGIGILMKRSWSISVGRLACVLMIVNIVMIIALHKEGFVAWSAMIQELGGEEVKPLGWMTMIRYMFLFCMCPIALIVGYGVVVKQYALASTEQNS